MRNQTGETPPIHDMCTCDEDGVPDFSQYAEIMEFKDPYSFEMITIQPTIYEASEIMEHILSTPHGELGAFAGVLLLQITPDSDRDLVFELMEFVGKLFFIKELSWFTFHVCCHWIGSNIKKLYEMSPKKVVSLVGHLCEIEADFECIYYVHPYEVETTYLDQMIIEDYFHDIINEPGLFPVLYMSIHPRFRGVLGVPSETSTKN